MFFCVSNPTKIKECFSNRLKLENYVLEGSIIGTLIFYINSSDIFYEYEDSDIENYVDDRTPYACASDINRVIYEPKITNNSQKTL